MKEMEMKEHAERLYALLSGGAAPPPTTSSGSENAYRQLAKMAAAGSSIAQRLARNVSSAPRIAPVAKDTTMVPSSIAFSGEGRTAGLRPGNSIGAPSLA